MTQTPHDIPDLYLAPVVLMLDARLEELGKLDAHQLAYEVALASDRADFTRSMREDDLIAAVPQLIQTHHWTLSWDARGQRLSHDGHTLVLRIPATFRQYLDGLQFLSCSGRCPWRPQPSRGRDTRVLTALVSETRLQIPGPESDKRQE